MVGQDREADRGRFFPVSPEPGNQDKVALGLAHLFPVEAHHAGMGEVAGQGYACE